MVVFEDIDDVKEWLEPLDYDAFWIAVEPWAVFAVDDRDHFDAVLAKGVTDIDTMLTCLKAEARITLTERFDLNYRTYERTVAKYLRRVH